MELVMSLTLKKVEKLSNITYSLCQWRLRSNDFSINIW